VTEKLSAATEALSVPSMLVAFRSACVLASIVLKFFDIFLPYEDKISSVEMIRALAVWSLSLPTRDVT
jgi:hypothetical protein